MSETHDPGEAPAEPRTSECRAPDPNARTADALRDARRGDDEAMARLVGRFGPHLEAYLRGRMRARGQRVDDTLNAAQEVWLRACRGIDRFVDRGTGSFWSYLRVIAKNYITKKRFPGRHVGLDRAEEIAAPSAGPEGQALLDEDLQRFEAALLRLEPPDRDALLLRLSDTTYATIAKRLRLAGGAVGARNLVARAKNRIQILMRDQSHP